MDKAMKHPDIYFKGNTLYNPPSNKTKTIRRHRTLLPLLPAHRRLRRRRRHERYDLAHDRLLHRLDKLLVVRLERARDVGEARGRRGKGLLFGARDGRCDLHIEHVQRFHGRVICHRVDAHPVFGQRVQVDVVRGVRVACANVALDRCDGGAFELEEDAVFVFDETHLQEPIKYNGRQYE